MNAIVALISAVSVFAVSAAFVDFAGNSAVVKGLHHGAHVAHFVASGQDVDGLKCGAHFSWALPEGKLLKEVLAFSHCKAGHNFHFAHVTLVGGGEQFLHFPAAGFPVALDGHVWFGKLAKGVCKHAPALAGLPHHAVLADLALVFA